MTSESSPVCTNCNNGFVVFVKNSVLYGRCRGHWPFIYYCLECGAAVGVHKNTHKPLGTLADAPTRQQRRQTHELFDPLWQNRVVFKRRADAYRWLSRTLSLPTEKAHIGMLSSDQCRQLQTAIVTTFLWRDDETEC